MRMKKIAVVVSLLVVAAVAFSAVHAVSTARVEAINKKCPFKNKDADASITSDYKGPKDKKAVTVAFCCMGCKKTFDAKPEEGIKKFPEYKAGAQ
jgi:hypothetical protein